MLSLPMMSAQSPTVARLPSATPNEAEIEAWQSLPRDEQLRRLRAMLAQPDCSIAAVETVTDVLAKARAKAAARHG